MSYVRPAKAQNSLRIRKTDQSLCKSLKYSMTVQLLAVHHFAFLRLTGGCICSYESIHVKMPHCWKSHVAAQIIRKRKGIYRACIDHVFTMKTIKFLFLYASFKVIV